MSDTPKTDEQAGALIDAEEVVPADFARELERENAALREERDAFKAALEYEVVDTERLHWLLVDRIKKEAQP